MPIASKDIEKTKEVPLVLQKMERNEFYTFDELYQMSYGSWFDDDTKGELWVVQWSQWTSLQVLLDLLVEQGKLVTGKKADDMGRTVKVRKRSVTLPPTVYYGLA